MIGGVNVKDFGAVGDFIADDTVAIQSAIDHCFGPASAPHGGGGGQVQNKPLGIPPGRYKITAPLLLSSVEGGLIQGGGRRATWIENVTGGDVFRTNGMQYSRVSDLLLVTSGTGICFDLNKNATSTVALQSNTFSDVFFQGGAYGIAIGRGGLMGSENLFQNCFWISQSVAGLLTANWNALQNTVIGGNFQSCADGILMASGTVTVISSVGFQQTTGYDVRKNSSALDSLVIQGCRTESQNFVRLAGGTRCAISGCTQRNSSGYFLHASGGSVSVTACVAERGRIYAAGNIKLGVKQCDFGKADWLQTDSLWYPPNNVNAACIDLEGVYQGWGDTPPAHKTIFKRRVTAQGTSGTL